MWTFYIAVTNFTDISWSHPCIQVQLQMIIIINLCFSSSPHHYTIASLISFSFPSISYALLCVPNSYLTWKSNLKVVHTHCSALTHRMMNSSSYSVTIWDAVLWDAVWNQSLPYYMKLYVFKRRDKGFDRSLQATFWAVIRLSKCLLLYFPVINQQVYLKRT